MFVGCASKPNNIKIDPYMPSVNLKIYKSKGLQKVYIKEVLDIRRYPYIIGTYMDDNKRYYVTTKTNLQYWLYSALQRGLKKRGFVVVDKPEQDSIDLKVTFTNVDIDYYEFENVLVAKVMTKFSIDNKLSKISETKQSVKRAKYRSVPSKSEYEKTLRSALSNIVNSIITKVRPN